MTSPVDFVTTFDFDGETIWKQRARKGPYSGPAFESQGTFGPKVGIWRVLDLLARYEIRATFFVPGWIAEHWRDAVAAVANAGHEIALHGYLHEPVNEFVGREDEELVLVRGLRAFEDSLGLRPRGYRPPAYIYSAHTLSLLRENGFLYGSAMADDDAAYLHAGQPPIVEIPVPWHLADDFFGLHRDVGFTPSQAVEVWDTELRGLARYDGRAFVPTLHPQVIGHPGRLDAFEQVVRTGIELGVRFMRCIDLAQEIHHAAAASPEGLEPDASAPAQPPTRRP